MSPHHDKARLSTPPGSAALAAARAIPHGTNTEVVAAIDRLPPDAIVRLYHGTTAQAARGIAAEMLLRPDDVRSVGLAATPAVARKYGLYHTGYGERRHEAMVLELAIRRSELGSADPALGETWLAEEVGGGGYDAVLVSGWRNDWPGVILLGIAIWRP